MTDKTNTIPTTFIDVYEAYQVSVGDTVYLTFDESGKPCAPVPVKVLQHSSSGNKVFVGCPSDPSNVLILDDFGLAYRGVCRAG